MDDPHQPLTFPDLPRLELDQLLGQLVDRAHEVIATQGRLRGLLHANQMIAGDLALPVLLHHIVDAARELAGARYAALGVNSRTGGLAQFVHAGMPPETVKAIGSLPHGKGLLGALVENPTPIRVQRIADDPRSSGFPPHHPPMNSFLGVPIRVRGEVFGNLYLCESNSGAFSSEDEDLVTALAATAGVAIANARLYDVARIRQNWLSASATITRRLLSPDTGNPLQLIVDLAHDVADADLVAVVLPATDGDGLHVEVAVGTGAQGVLGARIPITGSLCGQVLTTGQPLRDSWPRQIPWLSPTVSAQLALDPVLIVPLVGTRQANGVLVAARLRDRAAFTDDDLDMVTAFANQASLALELTEARAEQQRLAVADDRDRIAADLHDHVIQRLFAAGLSLQSIAKQLGTSTTASNRIIENITNLDQTISQIRTTIFQLHHTTGSPDTGLRSRILDVLNDVTPALGFNPETRFTGPLQSSVPDDIAEDLIAVLREALSNIARHANARHATVDITVHDKLTLNILDDGTGIPTTTRRSGLANMAARAERHGGTLSVARRGQVTTTRTGTTDTGTTETGTVLSWTVPIP